MACTATSPVVASPATGIPVPGELADAIMALELNTSHHGTNDHPGHEELETAIHPRLIEALSPSSPLYRHLWPIIIDMADWDDRSQRLVHVDPFFKRLANAHRRSDRAKYSYVGNREQYVKSEMASHPFYPIKLSLGEEWRCWSADTSGFATLKSFRAFCDLGDIDPEAVVEWYPYDTPMRLERFRSIGLLDHYMEDIGGDRAAQYTWSSRSGDLILDSKNNPLAGAASDHEKKKKNSDGIRACHYLGVTGRAAPLIDMYNYMHDNDGYHGKKDDPDYTFWSEMCWGRDYI